MAVSNNIRSKTCQGCGINFSCYSENCWCNDFPRIMPLPEGGDCYCPECLKKIIEEELANSANQEKINFMKKEDMVEQVDYYFNEQGYWVFTSAYHLKRGYCCEKGCKHCPYGFEKK